MSFRLKTIIGVALIEGCLLLILVWSGVNYLRESNENELALRARVTVESIANLTRDAVLSTDLARLDSVVARTLESPEIVYLRIMDSEQVLSQMGDAEALGRPFAPDANIEGASDGVFDVGVDVAEGDYRFGRVELGLSVERARGVITDARQHLTGIAVAEMVLVALFSYLLGAYLTRGLQELRAASRSISSGALGTCVKIKGRDELAETGRAFNEMSLRLAESQREMERANRQSLALAERLAEKEQRLATILGTAVDGFVTIDQRGIIDDINSAGAALFGYRTAELVGRNVSCLMPESHASQHDGYIRHYLETGEARVIGRGRRIRGMRRDGSTFPMDLAISEMTVGGKRMFVGLVRDLSDQLQAEAAARRSDAMRAAIVDANLDALVTIDDLDRIVEFSPVAEQMFGHARTKVMGQRMGELLIPPEMQEMHQRGMQRYLATGEGPVIGNRIEVQAVRADGTRFPIELTVQAIHFDDERYFTALIRDISDRKAEEQALHDARDRAEAASEAKSRFLAHMSHEIRSPMNAVLGSLGLLLDGELDNDQRLYAKTAQASGKVLLSLINDVLDFSKIEAGRVILEQADLALSELVRETLDLVAFRARDKGLYVAALIDPAIAPRVRGDQTRMRQILVNLLDNALKFTSAGSVVLTVEQLAGPGDRVRLRFSVQDTGSGIPSEAQAGLFEEFKQVDSSDSTRHGGSGLGLAICRGLAELMGGRIGFDSNPGGGSRFWVEIPFAPAAEAARPVGELPFHKGLAVGFEPLFAEALTGMCAAGGCTVEAVDDPEAAVAALGPGIGIVLVDARLAAAALGPFARAARQRGAKRLLLLAAGMTPQLVNAVVEGPFDDLLVCPLLVDDLFDGVAGNASSQGHGAKDDQAPPESASPGPVAAQHAARILLAEDSVANQVVATAILARQGYDVEVANNGREAVEHFAAGGYDLILMDLRMPELNGLQATAAIRSMPGGDRIPIVAMTANAMQEDVERCLAAGMDDFVAKPVDRRQLFDTLARHLPVAGETAPENGAEERQTGVDPGKPLLDEAVIQQLAEDVTEAAIPGMMQMFIDEAAMRAGRVLAALQDSSAAGLEDEAHTLKSSAGTFGALRLQALARDIEAACREGNRAAAEKLGRGLGTLAEETLAAYRQRFDIPTQTAND